MLDSYINKQLGDYRIVEEIGAGGMGTVYRAEHVHLKKNFAVKILPAKLAADEGFVQRFYDEARVMSDLRHPGIVMVQAMSCQDGVYFLAMDYVTGPEGKPLSLHDHLRAQDDSRLAEHDVRKWAEQVAEALAYAHKQGVVHRDIKPANIMIDSDGNARLTDFGLAKAIGNEFIISQIHETMQRTLSGEKTLKPTDSSPPLDTLSGQPTILPDAGSDTDKPRSSATSILGTYDYMAPEQRGEGGTIDQRTDIYSFGVLLYRLLTGRRPVGMAKPPSQAVPGLSEQWDTITARCLAFEKEERYQSAEELLTDLQDVAAAEREIMPRIIVVPDDHPTIQKAIEMAAEGDTVRVRPGVYPEELDFKNGINLMGEGMDRVTVRCDTKENSVFEATNCASGLITGFTFEHTGSDDGDARCPVVVIRNSSVEVFRCKIQNGGGHGMSIQDKSKAVVRECVFQSNGWHGIAVSGEGTVPTLKNNTCSQNEEAGIVFAEGASGVADGNTCTENGAGIAALNKGTAPTLKNNTCSKNETAGIGFSDGAGGVADGNTCAENKGMGIAASDTGTAPTLKSNTCSKNEAGGIVFGDGAGGVADGNTCTENESCGIAADGTGTVPTLKDNACSKHEGAGIRFTNGAGGVAEGNTCTENKGMGIAALNKGTAPTLKSNTCSKNEGAGIALGDGVGGVAEGNTCTENESCGIAADGTGTAPTLKDNTCSKNEGAGIRFTNGAGGVAEGNTCTENKSMGITALNKGTAPTLKNNTCSKNERCGIAFGNGAGGVASGNTCTENEFFGIAAEGTGTAPTLKNNTCSKNEKCGIAFSNGAGGVASGNTCTENELFGIAALNEGTAPTLKNNRCSKNALYGILFMEGARGVAAGNKCNDNGDWGIYHDDASKPKIRADNTASGNEDGQILRR